MFCYWYVHYKPALHLPQDFSVYDSKKIYKASNINFCSQVRKGATHEVIPQSYSESSFLICSVDLINFSNYHSTTLNVYILHELLCNKVCARSFWKHSGTAALQPKDSNKHQKSNSYYGKFCCILQNLFDQIKDEPSSGGYFEQLCNWIDSSKSLCFLTQNKSALTMH